MSFLLERDAVNGKEGRGFMTIDGENHEMFGLKKFQSDAEFQEADFKVVGDPAGTEKDHRRCPDRFHDDLLWNPLFSETLTGISENGKAPVFHDPDHQ